MNAFVAVVENFFARRGMKWIARLIFRCHARLHAWMGTGR
jgi:hypothetical protein